MNDKQDWYIIFWWMKLYEPWNWHGRDWWTLTEIVPEWYRAVRDVCFYEIKLILKNLFTYHLMKEFEILTLKHQKVGSFDEWSLISHGHGRDWWMMTKIDPEQYRAVWHLCFYKTRLVLKILFTYRWMNGFDILRQKCQKAESFVE